MSILNKTSGVAAHLARRSCVPNVLEVVPKRNAGFNATPPRIRVSFAEKVAHGLVMTAGVLATPVWILAHMEDYRNGNK